MKRIKKITVSVISLAFAAVLALPFGVRANAESPASAAEALPVIAQPAQAETAPAPETSVDRSFTFDESMAGKAFVFYGDSITERCGAYYTHKDYTQLLSEEFGFYAYNAGVSGATASVISSNTNNLFSQLEKTEAIYRDADYVSIFIGTNDFGNKRPLGTIDSMDKSTVYGAFNSAISTIVEANPDVKIMLCTPFWRGDASWNGFETVNGAGYTLADMCNAIKAVGAKHGCKVVDQTNVFNAENCTLYMNSDRLHLYESGYRLMVENIKNS